MTVVADYTYCISSGSILAPPCTVVFIDTSTGSPDGWHWEFGDGYSSDSQSPTHVYTSAGPFTCTLSVFEKTGSITTLNESGSFVTRRHKESGAPRTGDPAAEHAKFLATGWTTAGNHNLSSYYLTRVGVPFPGQRFFASEGSYKYDLSSYPSASNVAYLEARTVTVDDIDGVIELSGLNKFMDPPPTPINTYKFVADFSSYLGGFTTQFRIQDKDQAIPTPAPVVIVGDKSGWILDSRVIIQPFSSSDSASKTVDDLANAINFSANPQSGPNTLNATFTNLSPITHTTRSWRRRVNGSGAAFVEFSTAAAPSEIFDKTAP